MYLRKGVGNPSKLLEFRMCLRKEATEIFNRTANREVALANSVACSSHLNLNNSCRNHFFFFYSQGSFRIDWQGRGEFMREGEK